MAGIPETVIIGANGFIGRHLLTAYRRVVPETLGTTHRHEASTLVHLDLANPDVAPLCRKAGRFQAAIIAAAITSVNECARDPARSRQINVSGTLQLIAQLRTLGVMPIFLSSDYVFDGESLEAYPDDAPRSPSTEYGRQKAAVEQALETSGSPYLVLRLGKTYGTCRGDGTLLDEIAARLIRGETYGAAHDQVFNPTWVEDLPNTIMTIQNLGLRGVVNLCASEAWSRYDLAVAVAREFGVPMSLVRRISLDQVPGPERRPRRTRMVPRRLERETDVHFTSVEVCLKRLASEYRHGGKTSI